jgi:hypothetical protein
LGNYSHRTPSCQAEIIAALQQKSRHLASFLWLRAGKSAFVYQKSVSLKQAIALLEDF